MPELQEVRQDFTVDVSDYLAGLREMIAAATDLARADAEATAATRALSDELDSLVAPVADVADAMGIAAGRANDLRDAMATAAAASEEFGSPAGHRWAAGRVIVSWHPCSCPRALAHRERGAGHLVVRCGEQGCSSTWYRPRHDSDPG